MLHLFREDLFQVWLLGVSGMYTYQTQLRLFVHPSYCLSDMQSCHFNHFLCEDVCRRLHRKWLRTGRPQVCLAWNETHIVGSEIKRRDKKQHIIHPAEQRSNSRSRCKVSEVWSDWQVGFILIIQNDKLQRTIGNRSYVMLQKNSVISEWIYHWNTN